jgi:predicted lipoprotein
MKGGENVMRIKKGLVSVIIAGVLAVSISGCGIVKVIPKGEESKYTGATAFDAGATADEDWGAVVEEVTGKAEDLASVVKDAATGTSYAVKFSGKVTEYNTDTPKGYLAMTVDGVDGEVRLAVGKVVSGTAIRDCQTVKAFQDFENQTQWSAYAKTLNTAMLTNVVEANGLGGDTVGKTVDVVGCYAPASNGTILVDAVSVTVQ